MAGEYDASRGGVERGRLGALDVAAHLVPGDVLELGIGTGIVAEALLAASPQVRRLAGVDISADMLARARGRLPGRLVRGSVTRLPFPAASFDSVYAVHVLHLVPDMVRLLREARRVLRPGGRLVALHGRPEHAEDDDLAVAARGLGALDTRRDTRDAVRQTAEAVGLRVVHQGSSSPRPGGHSPAELADLIRRRSFSRLWYVDDADWQAVVEPVLAAVAALPDQDRRRSQPSSNALTVLAPA